MISFRDRLYEGSEHQIVHSIEMSYNYAKSLLDMLDDVDQPNYCVGKAIEYLSHVSALEIDFTYYAYLCVPPISGKLDITKYEFARDKVAECKDLLYTLGINVIT